MTPMPALLAIARHEAQQLRQHPPHTQQHRNTQRDNRQNRLALQLFAQHGRTPPVRAHRDWGNLSQHVKGEPLLPTRQAECGELSGYKRHRLNGEPVCRSCAQAHNRDVQDRARKAA